METKKYIKPQTSIVLLGAEEQLLNDSQSEANAAGKDFGGFNAKERGLWDED